MPSAAEENALQRPSGERTRCRLNCTKATGVDMIVTPLGEHVFLELNPNGQWLWMELITGAPMAEAMAGLLLE